MVRRERSGYWEAWEAFGWAIAFAYVFHFVWMLFVSLVTS